MKNLVYLIISFCLLSAASHAQPLSLSDDSGPVTCNTTVANYGSLGTDIILSYMYVTNNTTSIMNVKVKKVELYQIPGAMNVFCWGLCFPPDIYVSPDPLPVGPGETNNTDFHGEYYPSGTDGSSLIRYVFFNDANPSDSVSFNVKYSTGQVAGIETVTPNELVRGYSASLAISAMHTHFEFGDEPYVWLESGATTIPATTVVVNSNTEIEANFDIPANAQTGLWNLKIRSLFDEILVKTSALNIISTTSTVETEFIPVKLFRDLYTEKYSIINNSHESEAEIQLFTSNGSLVLNTRLTLPTGVTQIELPVYLHKGVFLFRLLSKDLTINEKIVIY